MTLRHDLSEADFPARRQLLGREGGAVYVDERDGRFYVISDESPIIDLSDEKDAAGLSAVTVREFQSATERDDYLRELSAVNRGDDLARDERSAVTVRWYGERGIVNAIVNHLSGGDGAVQKVRRFLRAVQWAGGAAPAWVGTFSTATLIVELGLADFGNPDLLVVCNGPEGVRLVFLEAKATPYLASMRPNAEGMRIPGFNSSINGQLALKYRFARALEATTQEMLAVAEPEPLLAAYTARVNDIRKAPRRLAKVGIVADILKPLGLIGLSSRHCYYVALTWDVPERRYYADSLVEQLDGLPVFLDLDGRDIGPEMGGQVGWLGYRVLESALDLSSDRVYQSALATMVNAAAPSEADYRTALAVGPGAPEAVPLMARLAALFDAYEVLKYPGSYSIKDQGRTIGKIMVRGNSVFLGLRDSMNPERWFPGRLETVSVQGVNFRGVLVPVDSPSYSDAEALAGGLRTD